MFYTNLSVGFPVHYFSQYVSRLCTLINNEDDTISLFSMLIFFASLYSFYYKLKKESDTIRNCSSNSPFPRGSTENRSLHFSSERFITHLQGVQIRYKIGKIIKYRQERKHYIYRSELLIISILLLNVKFHIENKLLL